MTHLKVNHSVQKIICPSLSLNKKDNMANINMNKCLLVLGSLFLCFNYVFLFNCGLTVVSGGFLLFHNYMFKFDCFYLPFF